ncbi:serine/arginine repetitive matrix protein 2-like isoform X2 [Syngnathoides biaculeatus]|uniref:serine/arginine repetitive matrix protein 2-like isoform X2 n=1 Tax=Syngnathoides biaculeatus TaxID=300417 RepID=UPI002ADE7086|nr:serine/arginine repetitive matrix protein 2-like isoform X2 [Syngnathoides biaculeatus]
MWSSKMATQWRAIDWSLNTGNVDFLSTRSPCQIGPCGGDNSGEDMDAQSCVEHSILAIFEDSTVSSEDTRQAEEESSTLLSALTQMLECVEDDVSSSLSPFDTIPDTKLLNYQELGHSMTTDGAFGTKLRPRAKNDAGKEEKSKVARFQPVFRQQSQTLFQGPKKRADTEVDVFTSSSVVNLVKLMHPYCLKVHVEEESKGHRSTAGLPPSPWSKLEEKHTLFSQGEVWKYEKPTGDSDEDINVVSDDDDDVDNDHDTRLKGTEDKQGVAKNDSSTLLKSALLTSKSSKGLFSKEKKRVRFGPVQVASFDQSVEAELFTEKDLQSVVSADTPEGSACPALVAPAAVSISVDVDDKAEEQLPKSKAKSLSLQEYRQLRQKRQPLLEKQPNYTTKWPYVPLPPKELTPIILSHGQRQTLCAIKSSRHSTEQSRISTHLPQRATCHHPPIPVKKKPCFAGKHHRFKYLQTESKSTSCDVPKSNDESNNALLNGAASRKNSLKNPALLSTDPPNPVLIRLPVNQTPAPSDSPSSAVSTVLPSLAVSQIHISTEKPQPSRQVESKCPLTAPTSSECRKPQNLMLVPKISHSLSPGPVNRDQGQPVREQLPEDPLKSSPPKKPIPLLQHTCSDQSAAPESGIEACDLTSLLEQFEEKQAKEEEEAQPGSFSNALPSFQHKDTERTSTLLQTSTKEQQPVRTLYSVTSKSSINNLERQRKFEQVTPESLGTEVILGTEEVVNVRRKTPPSKGIQIIDPRPLPSRRATELTPSPHTGWSVSTDHNYSVPVDPLHPRAPSSLLKNTCEIEDASIRKSESPIRAEEKYTSGSSTRTLLAPSLTPPPSPPSRGREKKRYPRRSPLSDSSCSSLSSSSSYASCSPKRRRSHRKRSGSRSWSSSPSRSVSRSPPRRHKLSSTRLKFNRSRSRSWSRSRSPSPSSTNFRTRRRNIYSESWKIKRENKARLQKLKAIDERRVVYVGRIRRSMTHDELRERFSHFGEVECVSLHFRDKGDHYGFVTFYNTDDAFAAIDNGGKLRRPDELPFDICFGGRRQFCNSDYADLDAKADAESSPVKSRFQELDFDSLLKQAQRGLR